MQNYHNAVRDKQLLRLLEILRSPKCNIWCLNIGETPSVSSVAWMNFMEGLKETKVTHMYASVENIGKELKNMFLNVIRNNCPKHTMHNNPDNLGMIARCTHCWWNPMNSKVLWQYIDY